MSDVDNLRQQLLDTIWGNVYFARTYDANKAVVLADAVMVLLAPVLRQAAIGAWVEAMDAHFYTGDPTGRAIVGEYRQLALAAGQPEAGPE